MKISFRNAWMSLPNEEKRNFISEQIMTTKEVMNELNISHTRLQQLVSPAKPKLHPIRRDYSGSIFLRDEVQVYKLQAAAIRKKQNKDIEVN